MTRALVIDQSPGRRPVRLALLGGLFSAWVEPYDFPTAELARVQAQNAVASLEDAFGVLEFLGPRFKELIVDKDAEALATGAECWYAAHLAAAVVKDWAGPPPRNANGDTLPCDVGTIVSAMFSVPGLAHEFLAAYLQPKWVEIDEGKDFGTASDGSSATVPNSATPASSGPETATTADARTVPTGNTVSALLPAARPSAS